MIERGIVKSCTGSQLVLEVNYKDEHWENESDNEFSARQAKFSTWTQSDDNLPSPMVQPEESEDARRLREDGVMVLVVGIDNSTKIVYADATKPRIKTGDKVSVETAPNRHGLATRIVQH